jgi:bifunctional non-homologous end joining protein LigD
VREGGKLTYVGKVGTGFNTKMMHDLMERMKPLASRRGAARGAARRPRAPIGSSRSWSPRSPSPNSPATASCATRASSRLREDKPASEVVANSPSRFPSRKKKGRSPTPRALGIKISNPDRVIFPTEKLTKGDLADYYAAIGRC